MLDKHTLERLKKRADVLFEKRSPVLTLWQNLADNFYGERSDFTYVRNVGAEVGTHLQTSYPCIVRRELGNAFASMLRYDEWFDITTSREDRLDHEAKAWLQSSTKIQRRAMEDREAQFDRATKEGDHDFATFGQCVITTEWDRAGTHLLYRDWHLRDVAWSENAKGQIDFVARRWKPWGIDLKEMFPKSISPETVGKLAQDPYAEIDCLHIVCSTRYIDDPKYKQWPYISIYIETRDCHPLECKGSRRKIYTIPRWQTVAGSQYAYSPATIIALPDARLLQAMTATLLRAGEKAVDPPMAARAEVIRSDLATYPGGVTWLDAEYDAKLGPALEALETSKHGLPFGKEMTESQMVMLREAFFLNKLTMPFPEREITVYEAGKRVAEYIRQALPLFRPMEVEYNGSLCEETFQALMYSSGPFGGAFGRIDQMPESLLDQEIKFKFKTPLREAQDQKKMFLLKQAKEMLVTVADIDKTAINILDAPTALRDALEGNITPQNWLRSPKAVEQLSEKQREAEEAAVGMEQLAQGAAAAKDVATANRDFAEVDQA